MAIKVGINGFGRMGRLGLRAGWLDRNFEVVAINEIATDAHGSAHLLQYDSVHGTWETEVSDNGSSIQIDVQDIRYTSSSTIDGADWSDCDIVIEATGKHHKKPESLQAYFDQGVKKVVVAAPTEGALSIFN